MAFEPRPSPWRSAVQVVCCAMLAGLDREAGPTRTFTCARCGARYGLLVQVPRKGETP